jgi:hypothetical protein
LQALEAVEAIHARCPKINDMKREELRTIVKTLGNEPKQVVRPEFKRSILDMSPTTPTKSE